MKNVLKILASIGLAVGIAVESAADNADVSGELIIFHAGSLAVPFKIIATAFSSEYPGVRVVCEAAGSRACARKISDLKRLCDVMASADYTVIDTLLIPKYATWNIKFAANEMVIVYDDNSRKHDEITSANWHEILLRSDVAFGRSDPNADPCGYRAVLAIKLAEKYYGKPGLANKLLKKDIRYIRPKETDLLALLQIREIDYIFLYCSVAGQHGLKYVVLPDEVNLKNPAFADVYKSVFVDISGKQPGTFITKQGGPMIYGVTIPKNAPNPRAALAFLEFLLKNDKGMAIMEQCGQQSVVPAPSKTYENIPDALRRFAKQADGHESAAKKEGNCNSE